MITNNLSTLQIHKLSQEQYDRELAAGNVDPNALYLTPDEEIDLSEYETKTDATAKLDEAKTYTDTQIANIGSSGEGKIRLLSGYSSSQNASVISSYTTTQTLSTPIVLNYDNPFEFELIVFGINGSGYSGTLQFKNASGTTLGTLIVNGSNYSATRTSKCHISAMSGMYVYTYEGEDYISYIQNSIPWTRSSGGSANMSSLANRTITQYTWTPTGTMNCYGFCLTYQELGYEE